MELFVYYQPLQCSLFLLPCLANHRRNSFDPGVELVITSYSIHYTKLYENQNDTVALGYRFFNVLPLPEPRLTLNDWPIDNPAVIDRAVLLNCDSLGVFFSDDLIGSISWMRISDFEVGYNYGGFHFSHHNESNQIGTETFEIFNKLGPNNEISLRVTVASDGRVTKHLPIYRLRVY